MPYFIGLVFLSYLDGSTSESAHVFIIMGLFALGAAVYAHHNGIRPFKWWDGKFNKTDLKWIGIAYVGLLAVVFAVTPVIGGSWGILVALGGGAVVLFLSLLKSESIIVPWFVHSLYNFTALALASASIITLAASPIYVPNFTFGDGRPADIATQFIMQFAFVAFSEEIVKVSLALGIFAFVQNRNVAIAVSAIAWVGLHTIVSYRVFLPF